MPDARPLCRASSTLPLPRHPSISVLWTAALELFTCSPLARVHPALQGAPPLNPLKIIARASCRSSRPPSRPPSSATSLRWPPYVLPCWSLRCWVWRSWPPPATPWLVPSQEPPPSSSATKNGIPAPILGRGARSVLSLAARRRRGQVHWSTQPSLHSISAGKRRCRCALVDAGSGAGGRCCFLVLIAIGAVRCTLPACGSSFHFAL